MINNLKEELYPMTEETSYVKYLKMVDKLKGRDTCIFNEERETLKDACTEHLANEIAQRINAIRSKKLGSYYVL
tara:strand:+ start:5995 stop:6216 length:222 start_codon:yes stop_codon:yes gene_type:complete